MNTLKAWLIFLPNPIFAIILNFQQQKSLKNQYLPHLSSENYEINSIKSDSLRAFQQHKEHLQIPIKFSVSILFNFHWRNGSIINSFHTVAPNSLKPRLTHPHSSRAFQRYQKCSMKQHDLRDPRMTYLIFVGYGLVIKSLGASAHLKRWERKQSVKRWMWIFLHPN